TLERWATTIADAIKAAQALPGVETSKTLVIGISEGCIVAMRVSNVSPVVTHAASLSGGGPVYLTYPTRGSTTQKPRSATKFRLIVKREQHLHVFEKFPQLGLGTPTSRGVAT